MASLIQPIIDADELDQYWHPELPERAELCVVGQDVANMPNLTWRHGPVRLLSDSVDVCVNRLVVKSTSVEESQAELSIEYPPEGLVGQFWLSRQPTEVWRIDSATVVER